MTERAWKQLLREALHDAPRTPASDAVLRLALSMLVNDVQADVSPDLREAIAKRLEVPEAGSPWQPLTVEEKAQWREPVLAYLKARNAKLVPIVAPHFREGDTMVSCHFSAAGRAVHDAPATHVALYAMGKGVWEVWEAEAVERPPEFCLAHACTVATARNAQHRTAQQQPGVAAHFAGDASNPSAP